VARTVLVWKSDTAGRLYEFDAVVNEAPTHEVALTDYPIELGANLVDHIRPKPVQLRLTAWVSNAPARAGGLTHLDGMVPGREMSVYVRQPLLNAPPSAQLPTSIAGNQLTRGVPVTASVRTWAAQDGSDLHRVEKIYAELRDSMSQAREFSIAIDLLGEFEHMVMRSLRTERDGKSGNSLKLDMEFQQVTYASLFRDDVSGLLPKPKQPRSKPAVDAGKAAEKEADPKTQEATETLAHRVGDSPGKGEVTFRPY
jgi:hypothetical protein